MSKFWLTTWAVGISILFLYHPFLALAVGAGFIIYLNRKPLIDSAVKATTALWIITVFAVSTQLLVGWVTTDLSLDALFKEYGGTGIGGGLVGILMTPGRIMPIMLGQGLVYLVALGVLVRLMQSEHQNRWAKRAVLLGITALAHQGIDYYYPVDDAVLGAKRGAITAWREAFHRRMTGYALGRSRQLDLNNFKDLAVSKQPKRQYLVREEMMYAKDGRPIRKMEVGDSVVTDYSCKPIALDDFPEVGMYCSLYVDEFGIRRVGYLIPDCLSDTPTGSVSGRTPRVRLRRWEVANLREVTVHKSLGWNVTGMVPDQNTIFQYEIRTPGVELMHLWARTGEGGQEAHPTPRRLDDGRTIGENAVTVPNILGQGLQLKLSNDCPVPEVTLAVTMQVSS